MPLPSHGGFSRAAERLNLTQPAVSDHVRKLEETYGVQLFQRAAQGVTLTDMGRKLFAIAERQFEAEAEAHGTAVARPARWKRASSPSVPMPPFHVLPQLARFRAAAIRRLPCVWSPATRAELLKRLRTSPSTRGHSRTPVRARPSCHGCCAATRWSPWCRARSKPRSSRTEFRTTRDPAADPARGRLDDPHAAARRSCTAVACNLHDTIEIESREAAREAAAQGLGARHHVGRRTGPRSSPARRWRSPTGNADGRMDAVPESPRRIACHPILL